MNQESKELLPYIQGYFDNSLTPAEQEAFMHILDNDAEARKTFVQHVENYRSCRQIALSQSINKKDAWKKLLVKLSVPYHGNLKHLKNKSNAGRNLSRWSIYTSLAAACIVVFYATKEVSAEKSIEKLEIKNSEVTLTLSSGENFVLGAGQNKLVKDSKGRLMGESAENTLSHNGSAASSQGTFCTLKVPFGKKYNVTLSDNTKVYLNSGTSIVYPQKFVKGSSSRDVKVYGEAYFEVAEDSTAPFFVHTQDMTVKVLGTHFNVHCYDEEDHSFVVLAKGAVSLANNQSQVTAQAAVNLKPEQMGYFDKNDRSIVRKKVFSEEYTAWLHGKVIYRDASLKELLRGLERHFNVQIQCRNKNLSNQKINANFGDEKLPQVLEYLKEDFGLDYEIQDNKIVLN
ncbi:FecR family protein [Flavobacterium luteolum]|uniref:FecR family protein n=1 Tax=Flavobacterium luteolum TaxID=3003259 RepID=UPI00248EF6D5|nr:FecR domain-containing protein [Flavobacterium luteolum]